MIAILDAGCPKPPSLPHARRPGAADVPYPTCPSALTHAQSVLRPVAHSGISPHDHTGHIYFTDGSAMEVATDAGMVQATGSAFVTYHPNDIAMPDPYTPYLIRPSSAGVFNENYRAELVPIHAALLHHAALFPLDAPPSAVHIYTDSLSSMQALANAVFRPHVNRRKLHNDLLSDIARLILARSAAGLHTHFHKVKAHASVDGNECADAAAKDAA